MPFGLPLVNKNLKVRRCERGDLDVAHGRNDSVDEALAVAAQAGGLEGTPGTVANLARSAPASHASPASRIVLRPGVAMTSLLPAELVAN
jgi:hypothetical protein